jgi:5-methylcytosine-specific restriction endonuclease McrA
MPTKKTCKTCGVSQPLSNYHMNGAYYRGSCKQCYSQQCKQYAAAHAPEIKQWKKKNYAENRDTYLASAKKFYQDNPEKARERIERIEKWQRENPDKVKSHKGRWRVSNPKYGGAWAARKMKDPEFAQKKRDCARDHRKKNPDLYRAKKAKRRAYILSSPGSFTKADIKEKFSAQSGLCVYCGHDLRDTGYHADHRIPLSKGGTNDSGNIQLTCPKCNLRKRDMMPEDFKAMCQSASSLSGSA